MFKIIPIAFIFIISCNNYENKKNMNCVAKPFCKLFHHVFKDIMQDPDSKTPLTKQFEFQNYECIKIKTKQKLKKEKVTRFLLEMNKIKIKLFNR
ncbi:MAG: hypothetical protein GY830_03605 [Bacteroidetes bacterium]|nr:hypothetical protein [Bacteroidota bacterium]